MSTGAPTDVRSPPAHSDREILDLVDADNTVIGTVARSRVHGAPALHHRAVHVLVYDARGRLLLQKRSAGKEIQPGKWDTSVGGHLAAGESYPAAAVRETAEELGLAIDVDALVPVHGFVWRSPVETEHVTSYRIECGGPFRPHPEEIDELRFWSTEQLRAATGTGALTPMLEHELALLGVLAGDAGAGAALDPAYLDPGGAALPAKPPPRAAMNPATRALHDAIDATMRRLGQPYLHPDGETLQLDLFGSAPMVHWQERKAAAVFLAAEAWSGLPQTYGRYGTESGRLLLAEVCRMERAAGALLTDGGMQAFALACDVLFAPGSHAVVTRSVYNKTKSYLQRLAGRQGGEVRLVDDGDLDAIERALCADTSLLFTETYSNPHTRAVDPPALAAVAARARAAGCARLRVVVDNTVATPWGLREPLLSVPGIDVVVASGTKALAGQDRDMWGYVASNQIDLLNEGMDLQAMRGGILDWRRARAILAGLEGARARFERRCATAAAVARFLARHPRVAEALHPSLPDHLDADVIARHYLLPGSMVSFRLRGADDEVTRHFCDVLAMTGVPRYALSFDGLATKINHHRSVSEYFAADAEVRRIGVDRLVRLGIGVEDERDLAACLNWALWRAPEVPADTVEEWQVRRRRTLGIS